MGFLDKAKAAATQATAKAQQGMAQGQSKLDGMQAKKELDGHYRNLGEALYAEQRSGGSHEAVASGLAAIDEWHARQAAAGQADGPMGSTGSMGSTGTATAGPGSNGGGDVPEGNFTLDD